MSVDAPPELVRELLATPRASFVATRTERVKELRGEDRRDEAAAVAKLRKPSLVTWAVNAALREAPDAAGALVDAIRRLQSPGDLDARAMTNELEARLDELVAAGAAALGEAGERVDHDRRAKLRSALRATALVTDPDEFVDARVTDAERQGGDATLEAALLAGAHGRSAGRSEPSSGRATADDPTAGRAERAARQRAAAERRRIQGELRAARRAHAEADDRVRVAARELRAAERAARDAERRVTELQRQLAD